MKQLFIGIALIFPLLAVNPVSAHTGDGYREGRDWRDKDHRRPEQLEALRIWKMTEYLELEEKQAMEFFPALQEHQDQMAELDSSEHSIHRKLHEAIKSGKVDQDFINAQINAIVKLENQRQQLRAEFLQSLSQYLTPEQQAKFLVFDRRFRQALQSMVRQRDMRHK